MTTRPPTHDDLLDALELGSLVIGPVADKAWYPSFEGVVARESTISSPLVNLVAKARLDAATADDVITRVRDHYTRAGKVVGWMVGPRSTPPDLGARLGRAGFEVFKECLALADVDLDRLIPTTDDVVVRRATRADIDTVDRLKAATFDLPLAAARWIDEMLFEAAERLGTLRVYLASIDDEPVAFAQTFLLRESGVMILGGAGTLPSARGRGVFRTLLAHRYRDARAEGLSAATIQSYEDTSAPICKRLGFRELGRLTHYRWSPPPG